MRKETDLCSIWRALSHTDFSNLISKRRARTFFRKNNSVFASVVAIAVFASTIVKDGKHSEKIKKNERWILELRFYNTKLNLWRVGVTN